MMLCAGGPTDKAAVGADVTCEQPGRPGATVRVWASNGVAAPSRTNITEPLGGRAGWLLGGPGHSVAVNVTSWPYTDGLAEEDTVVIVGAWVICWMTVPELELKFPSPE